mmetsp:Transcript_19478/g.44621  ORF Transcript_19478/g.44621 Transcript_19478/m.44621 type:complete len:510 (-) Transcript_19478:835-2364(-)
MLGVLSPAVVVLVRRRRPVHPAVGTVRVGQVRLRGAVRDPLVLDLEPLVPDLEAVHLLDGELGRHDRVVGDEAESLRLARVAVDVDLGADDVPEGVEGRGEVGVGQVDGEVVDEQVGTGGTLPRPRRGRTGVVAARPPAPASAVSPPGGVAAVRAPHAVPVGRRPVVVHGRAGAVRDGALVSRDVLAVRAGGHAHEGRRDAALDAGDDGRAVGVGPLGVLLGRHGLGRVDGAGRVHPVRAHVAPAVVHVVRRRHALLALVVAVSPSSAAPAPVPVSAPVVIPVDVRELDLEGTVDPLELELAVERLDGTLGHGPLAVLDEGAAVPRGGVRVTLAYDVDRDDAPVGGEEVPDEVLLGVAGELADEELGALALEAVVVLAVPVDLPRRRPDLRRPRRPVELVPTVHVGHDPHGVLAGLEGHERASPVVPRPPVPDDGQVDDRTVRLEDVREVLLDERLGDLSHEQLEGLPEPLGGDDTLGRLGGLGAGRVRGGTGGVLSRELVAPGAVARG